MENKSQNLFVCQFSGNVEILNTDLNKVSSLNIIENQDEEAKNLISMEMFIENDKRYFLSNDFFGETFLSVLNMKNEVVVPSKFLMSTNTPASACRADFLN